jgi:hypothetical protein
VANLNSKQRRVALHAARKAGVPALTTKLPPADKKLEVVPKPSPVRLQLRRARRWLGPIISAIATVVTLLGVYTLKPSIVIEPYSSTDPTSPFAQQFSVQNASVYSIHHVVPVCGFPQDSNFNLRNFGLARTSEQIETLEAGSKTTLTCSIGTGPIRQEMNITPLVKYVTPLGFHLCKAFNFKGKPAVDGTYIWTYHGSAPCVSN